MVKLIDYSPEDAARVAGGFNAVQRPPFTRTAGGVTNRNAQIMRWSLPDGNSIAMYINPQHLQITEKKVINETRTKGGYVIQYWGDDLTRIKLSGTTGSSGVKGIEVLRNIYRSENQAFELVAAQKFANFRSELEGLDPSQPLGTVLNTAAKNTAERNFLFRPSLGSLAVSVRLFYQGLQYRGYFTDFSVTENVDQLGLFNYELSFAATERSGSRENFMPWHKEPTDDGITSSLINGIGNAVRGSLGFSPTAPEQYHPESAPYTFTGASSDEEGNINLDTPQDSQSILF